MKTLFLCLLFTIFLVPFSAAQNSKGIITGFSFGFSPGKEDGIYLGGSVNSWPDKKLSPVFQVFAAKDITSSFRLGSYLEYESAKFDNWNIDEEKATRLNLGINWLGRFPAEGLQIQLGGYAGGGYVNSGFTVWEKPLYGFDLGMLGGPAFEMDKIGIACHVHSGFAWYFGDTEPESVNLMLPKILFKLYYRL